MGNQPTNALSIYGQSDAAMDDFPVLKAFQQYIDAEQSKSRKRMILLCMFFGALMTILVAVFVFMLAQASRDKQHVNDQLIEFLMKERDRVPVAAPQPAAQPVANPAQDAALKAMTETLSALQKQMADQRKAAAEEAAKQPTKAELERARLAEEEAAKLKRAQEQLAAEKRRLADEKEKLRQQEIERQRRRLYPEYYQRQEKGDAPPAVESPSPKKQPKKMILTDKDIDDILNEVDNLKALDEAKAKKQKTAREQEKAKAKKPQAEEPKKEKPKDATKKDADSKKSEDDAKVDQPIQYFTDKEYALPVKVDGKDSNWSLSLE